MDKRGPDAREETLAHKAGLTIEPHGDMWAIRSSDGIIGVVDGTPHSWGKFRGFVLGALESGFRFGDW